MQAELIVELQKPYPVCFWKEKTVEQAKVSLQKQCHQLSFFINPKYLNIRASIITFAHCKDEWYLFANAKITAILLKSIRKPSPAKAVNFSYFEGFKGSIKFRCPLDFGGMIYLMECWAIPEISLGLEPQGAGTNFKSTTQLNSHKGAQ